MCDSQYSSLLKISENIKGKFEDSLYCLCVRGTSAPWYVAPRRVISAPYITALTPRVYFCKKLQKRHICKIISRKWLNCKNYGRLPRSHAARAGRPAAGRPAPRDLRVIFSAKFFSEMPLPPDSGTAGIYSCKFPNRKYIFCKKWK